MMSQKASFELSFCQFLRSVSETLNYWFLKWNFEEGWSSSSDRNGSICLSAWLRGCSWGALSINSIQDLNFIQVYDIVQSYHSIEMLISCHKYVCQTRSQPDISYEKRCRWVTSGGVKLHLSIDVKIVRWEKSELYLTNSEQSSTIHNWLVYLRCFTSMHFPACRKKSGTSKGMIEMPLKKKREKATNSDHEKWDRMWHHITSSHHQEGPFCLSLSLPWCDSSPAPGIYRMGIHTSM